MKRILFATTCCATFGVAVSMAEKADALPCLDGIKEVCPVPPVPPVCDPATQIRCPAIPRDNVMLNVGTAFSESLATNYNVEWYPHFKYWPHEPMVVVYERHWQFDGTSKNLGARFEYWPDYTEPEQTICSATFTVNCQPSDPHEFVAKACFYEDCFTPEGQSQDRFSIMQTERSPYEIVPMMARHADGF